MRVAIATPLAEAILDHAARADPQEACGLLFGRADRVDAVEPARNVAPDPRCRFEIDPALLLRAHRDARAGGPPLVGWYHSHPDGAPLPSARDAAAAHEDDRLWLIAAAGALTAYRTTRSGPIHGRFTPVALERV